MSYSGLLINTSDIIRRTFDKWGDETSSITMAARPCRIMYETKLIRSYEGEEMISFAKLFYGPGEDIEHQDQIKFGGIEHAIITIKKPQDSSHTHHIEAYVK
jgi:hypothetical protein